jgi:myo-inositol-1(or 4)-monophosphatase
MSASSGPRGYLPTKAAGCVVTGTDGQPLHTGAGGLVVAADEQTHAALLTLVGNQRARRD